MWALNVLSTFAFTAFASGTVTAEEGMSSIVSGMAADDACLESDPSAGHCGLGFLQAVAQKKSGLEKDEKRAHESASTGTTTNRVISGTQSCPRVCIFDIDNTVTVGHDCEATRDNVIAEPSPHWPTNSGTTSIVLDVLKKCHNSGFKLAFASAESEEQGRNAIQYAFITSLEPIPGLFNKTFFDSPAYQQSWNVVAHTPATAKQEYPRKDAMIMNIMKYYNVVPDCFGHSIMFDDAEANLETARNIGLGVVQASPECGGVYCKRGCGLRNSALAAIQPNPFN